MVVGLVVGAAAIVAAGALITSRNIGGYYRVVPTSEAHLVTNRKGMTVYTSDKGRITNAAVGNAYFDIPEHIPWLGCRVRPIDLTIKEVCGEQVAYEKGQARFMIDWSLKYKVVDVMKAAETSRNDRELNEMLVAPIEAAVNSITTGYDVTVLRSSKIEIQEKIKELLEHDLGAWGLDLVTFQLGDFKDTHDSSIISDISKRTEAKINSETRIIVAQKNQEAKIKEAEAAELSGRREIEKESRLATEKELMLQNIAEQSKETATKEAEVERIKTVQAAEIAREKAKVEADMRNEIAEKAKIRAQLEGESERIRAEQQAEADKITGIKAAEMKSEATKLEAESEAFKKERMAQADSTQTELNGAAAASAKEKMANALKQFTPEAVEAMTAEMRIQANKEIGIAAANALSEADVKAFIGGENSFGFDIGKIIEAFSVANPEAGTALMNRLARPNEIGSLPVNVTGTAVVSE